MGEILSYLLVGEREVRKETLAFLAAEHAKTAHGLTTIPPEVAAKAQAAIKDK